MKQQPHKKMQLLLKIINSHLFLLTSIILAFIGYIIPFFIPIFLFCNSNSLWAWISIAATIISVLIGSSIAKLFIIFQLATESAAVANLAALVYHALLLVAVITIAPPNIWCILIIAAWEIARHPMQIILILTRRNVFNGPLCYVTNPPLRVKTMLYSTLQIYITGYASIIAALILLLK